MERKRILIYIALIALGTAVFWKSWSAYEEAETHLTPASVSVSGYTRRDGTYVRPYNRRPPGGAIHDRPYESAIFFYSTLMIIGGGLVIIPIGMMLRMQIHTARQKREKHRVPPREPNQAKYELQEDLDEKASKEAAEEAFRKLKEEVEEAEARTSRRASKEELDKEFDVLVSQFKEIAKKSNNKTRRPTT